MNKIIRWKPTVVKSCRECPFHRIAWVGFLNHKARMFCSRLNVKSGTQEFDYNNKGDEYSYLMLTHNLDEIHPNCPLEDEA